MGLADHSAFPAFDVASIEETTSDAAARIRKRKASTAHIYVKALSHLRVTPTARSTPERALYAYPEFNEMLD